MAANRGSAGVRGPAEEDEAMKIRSETRKIERSAAEKARLRAIRAKYQREKPSLGELAARGATVVPLGTYLAFQRLLAELREARQKEGLTLEQVAERAGIPALGMLAARIHSRSRGGKTPSAMRAARWATRCSALI